MSGHGRFLNSSLFILLSISSVCGLASGQVTTGTISGVVQDETGAVLPGAKVMVENLDTGMTRTAITDDQGRYRFPQLPLGSYEVQAELSGFQTGVRSGITLTVGREATIDFTLKVGELTEEGNGHGRGPIGRDNELSCRGVG